MGIFDSLQDLVGGAADALPIEDITGAVEGVTGAAEDAASQAQEGAQGAIDDITQNFGL